MLAMRSKTLKSPREVGLDKDLDSAAGGDDSEQDGRSVRAFGAAREEHVEPQLREVLELALGGRVVDWDLRVVDESEECFAMISIVSNCGAQRIRGQEHGRGGSEPLLKVVGNRQEVETQARARRPR